MSVKNEYSKKQKKLGHLNHMDGVSYDINNPINQLRIVSSSCFFGEPMYYAEKEKRSLSNQNYKNNQITDYLNSVLGALFSHKGGNTEDIIESVIEEALCFDPEQALKEAVRLRREENIRTTPQIIMVCAANHENVRGTGLIAKYAPLILSRTDEAAVQLEYQLNRFGKPIPNSLKKAWKKFLETRSEYDLAKYRMENKSVKTLDVVNLVRPYSDAINKLMRGQLVLKEQTWESLISKNGSTSENWEKAIDKMGHMALLRNISNFEKNLVSPSSYIPKLVETAKNGKQLPFRYYSAYKKIMNTHGNSVSSNVYDALEECLEISIGELPRFSGKVMSLCDNSGSAHGTMTSSMGTVKVSEIANLTAILTGRASDDGYVGVFGDKLEVVPVRKKDSVFTQLKKINKIGDQIGHGTENGIWLFFNKAIKEKEHWDHIFVYSDMQAGHGGLYGLNEKDYDDFKWKNGRNIDVAKLVKTYRKEVNPDVKVYLVQMAGYKDTLMPEFYKDTYILGGWGDGILRFANYLGNLNNPSNTIKKKVSSKMK